MFISHQKIHTHVSYVNHFIAGIPFPRRALMYHTSHAAKATSNKWMNYWSIHAIYGSLSALEDIIPHHKPLGSQRQTFPLIDGKDIKNDWCSQWFRWEFFVLFSFVFTCVSVAIPKVFNDSRPRMNRRSMSIELEKTKHSTFRFIFRREEKIFNSIKEIGWGRLRILKRI